MKIIRTGDATFQIELEPADASEGAVAEGIRDIGLLLEGIVKRGFNAETRAADRGGYWRYSEVERALGLIRDTASATLRQIELRDFPHKSSGGNSSETVQ